MIFRVKSILITAILLPMLCASGCHANQDPVENIKIKGKFVFSAIRDAKLGWGVYIQDGLDGMPKMIGPKMGSQAWSPDGTNIACGKVRENNIYIINTEGSVIECIPCPVKPALDNVDSPGWIDWSDDGILLLYTLYEKQPNSDKLFQNLYVYNMQMQKHTKIFGDTARYSIINPIFSPDNKRILVKLTDDLNGVYLINTDGSDLTKIKSRAIAVGWSPDSKYVYYDTNIGDDGKLINNKGGCLFRMDIETKEVKKMRDTGFMLDTKISKDGKYIYYTKPIGNAGHVICVSPIDDETKEIQITKPVVIGSSGKYSQDFSPDWYQGD